MTQRLTQIKFQSDHCIVLWKFGSSEISISQSNRILKPCNFVSVSEKPKNDYNNKNQSGGNSPIKVELQNNMDRYNNTSKLRF